MTEIPAWGIRRVLKPTAAGGTVSFSSCSITKKYDNIFRKTC
jgi:hypothetical protein